MVKSLQMKRTLLILGMLVAFAAAETKEVDAADGKPNTTTCANLEKIIGTTSKDIEGKEDPDVNQLPVLYRTKSFTHEYKLSNVVESLEKAGAIKNGTIFALYVHAINKELFVPISKQIDDFFLKSDLADQVTFVAVDCSSILPWLFFRFPHFVTSIGHKLAEVTVALKQKIGPPRIHVVGEGLLTHACGFMGNEIFAKTGQKIERITGLDPSFSCSADVVNSYTLKKTDAEYVDIIHSNDGVFGNARPLGHADYYPNNGESQPGCSTALCSHIRPNALLFESALLNYNFPAVRCDSWDAFKKGQCYDEISYMGDESKPGTRGLFFLQTGGSYPYGLGIAGTKYVGPA